MSTTTVNLSTFDYRSMLRKNKFLLCLCKRPVNFSTKERNEVGYLRVKPFELRPFRVKPRPRPKHTHFRQGLNSKKEIQLGKFKLSPVKKEALNYRSY
jgi:hypothetical protein